MKTEEYLYEGLTRLTVSVREQLVSVLSLVYSTRTELNRPEQVDPVVASVNWLRAQSCVTYFVLNGCRYGALRRKLQFVRCERPLWFVLKFSSFSLYDVNEALHCSRDVCTSCRVPQRGNKLPAEAEPLQ